MIETIPHTVEMDRPGLRNTPPPALVRQLSSEGRRLFACSLEEYNMLHAQLGILRGTGPRNKPERQMLKQRLQQLRPAVAEEESPHHSQLRTFRPAAADVPTYKSIIFVRHGQSTAQEAGRRRKQAEYLDAPLTRGGERQAAALGSMPFCHPPHSDTMPWPQLVVVSPLTRALQVNGISVISYLHFDK